MSCPQRLRVDVEGVPVWLDCDKDGPHGRHSADPPSGSRVVWGPHTHEDTLVPTLPAADLGHKRCEAATVGVLRLSRDRFLSFHEDGCIDWTADQPLWTHHEHARPSRFLWWSREPTVQPDPTVNGVQGPPQA